MPLQPSPFVPAGRSRFGPPAGGRSSMFGLLSVTATGATLDPSTTEGALLWFVVFVLIAVVAGWLIGRTVHRLDVIAPESDLVQRSRTAFLLRFLRVAIVVVLFVLWAHLVPQLRALGTALLASASVASIVLGIAAQNTLGNLIAGMSILVYEPIRVGDRIQVSGLDGVEVGVVESVDLSHTVVTTYDNRRVTVPNALLMNQTIVNLSAKDLRAMAQVAIGVDYDADIEVARSALRRLAEAHPGVQEIAGIPVTALGASAVTITARLWCADSGTARQVEFDLYESALAAFREAGIGIPYPWSNVMVHRPASGGT